MSRTSEGTVAFLLGLVLITMVAIDMHVRYVKPYFGIALGITGAILLVLAAATLVRANREERLGETAAHHDHGPGCDHHGGPRVGWLLTAPVVVMALVVPPALGADAAARQDDSLRRPPETSFLPPLPDGDPAEVDLAVFTMHATTDDGATLEGREVALVGFVTPADDGGWFVTRMALQCCAADAFAFKIKVLDASAPPADTWVKVTGSFVPASEVDTGAPEGEADYAPPAVRATSVEDAEEPNPPYI